MRDSDDLLHAIQNGDVQSFAAWVAYAEPRLRRRLASFATRVDVEVMVQETLLRIWQGARHHRADGAPHSLLRQAVVIARNLCIDEARRRGREVPMDDRDLDGSGVTADANLQQSDPMLMRRLVECLQRLQGVPSRVMQARLHARGASDRAMAQRLGMPVNTFRQNVSRARRALIRCLADNGVVLSEHWQ